MSLFWQQMPKPIYWIALLLVGCSETPEPEVPEVVPPGITQIHLHDPGNIVWEKKEPITVTIISPEGDTLQKEQPAKAKYRGGLTSRYHKHSYTVKLDKKVALGGMESNDDWMLIASYNDKSFMRHKLGYDLFRAFDEDNISPNCAFAEVYEDSTYLGLYVITEKMGAKRLRLDKSFEGAYIFKDPPLFRNPGNPPIDNGQPPEDFFHQKWPAVSDTNHNAQIETIQRMIHTYPDQMFAETMPVLFDLKNLADWFILIKLTNNGDGIFKNFYLYHPSKKTGNRICPWDYDHTFGRDGDNEMNETGIADPTKSVLFKRLLDDNLTDFKNIVKARYEQHKANGIITEENIIGMMDANYDKVSPYLQRNFERWPANADDYFDDYSTEKELEYMQSWTRKHLKYLNDYMNSL